MSAEDQNYSNNDLAEVFERISSLLEIKGEMVFKIRSYQRAAESLRALGEDIHIVAAEGRLNQVPGVGKAIAEKIQELLSTGKLGFLEKLENEVPPTLLELLEVPDVGPRRAALFWKELGIVDLAGLEKNARAGKLRGLPGMGEKTEARIIAGIEARARRTDRMTLGLAWSTARRWLDWLRVQPGVLRAEAAGSLRRWRETIGDLDLVAAVAADSPVMENFIHHPEVQQILGQGDTKASVELKGGVRIQLWVASSGRFGGLWAYATGSKAHNVRMRDLALKKKLSLSDRGLLTEDGQLWEYAEEPAVYAALGLPWIPPELREDRGEIEAALKKRLPRLIETADFRAELHTHTTWSDGVASVREMAQAAITHGYQTYAITDHDASLGITRGLDPQRLAQQAVEIKQVQAELGDSLRLLHGIEVDILSDGSLALPDDVLAGLDIVIASLHVNLRQPREAITKRLLSAVRNPLVDVIGHPSGRLLPNREGADLDWDAILSAAKESGVALEINASPSRLDLNDVYAHRAIELGIPLVINTDAHSPRDLDETLYGVSVARRAWAPPEVVINTWDTDRIVEWLEKRETIS
jgi:DNA polymerase (family 10)